MYRMTTTKQTNAAREAGQPFTIATGETLPAGAKFTRWVLTNGEEEPANFIDIVEGYHPDNYFRDGKYLGADEAGVEPQFVITETFDVERTQGQIDFFQRAKHLEAIWIERETKERQVAESMAEDNEPQRVALFAAKAEATKQCRLDLQYEFELIRRLGPGPLTQAEAEAFLAVELNQKWEDHPHPDETDADARALAKAEENLPSLD